MSALARFLRDDDAVMTVEWGVVAGFAVVGFALHSEMFSGFFDQLLEQMRAALRTLGE